MCTYPHMHRYGLNLEKGLTDLFTVKATTGVHLSLDLVNGHLQISQADTGKPFKESVTVKLLNQNLLINFL